MPIRQQYQGARRRLLLFDYDGTLVDFAPTPAEAKPTSAMLRLLGSLTADPRNTVVIISGRDHATL
jgi:trehalose 6-phosphate synthase/phosphatase